MREAILTGFVILLIVAGSAPAATRLVPSEYADIQAAVDDCNDGDVVVVAPGTYTGDGNRDIDFEGKAITVRSVDPCDPNIVAATIIDCNGTAAEPHRGFYFDSGEDANSILEGFTITNGYASRSGGGGGGIYCRGGNLVISNCRFVGNSTEDGGGGVRCSGSGLMLINCTFEGNSAYYGGGIYNHSCDIIMINCAFTGNSAIMVMSEGHGGGIHSVSSNLIFNSCTFAGNSSEDGSTIACKSRIGHSNLRFTNCVIWEGINWMYNGDDSEVTITYSDVQGGWPGEGNIDADPLFVNPDGNDYHLQYGSACIDAGDNSAIPLSVTGDLDGGPRIIDSIVDMGAYELGCNWYVDKLGDDNNDGLSRESAFATIQKGIDSSQDGDVVLVYPGLYTEKINFLGKAITVQSAEDAAVLEAEDYFAVLFYNGERPGSVLKNFVIRNSFVAIFIDGSSPTISNLTVADNMFGIAAYGEAQPSISNSIFWYNIYGDIFGCEARYSCTAEPGQGNIDVDQLFADPDGGDYHLLSEWGRCWPEHDVWVLDEVTSPCIDGGDPAGDYSSEPIPDGGRINMGAYGGTAYASMKEMRWRAGDINHDGWINMTDFVMMAESWLTYEPPTSNIPPVVNILDLHDEHVVPYEPIQIEADAWDVDGLVRIVEFFADEIEIGGDDDGSDGWRANWLWWETWESYPNDSYNLTAKATDDDGAVTTSLPIEINVEEGGKGRFCFPVGTGVWIDGELVRFSEVVAGQRVAGFGSACVEGYSKQVECIEKHEGVFFEFYDIVLESGNHISVVGSHLFLIGSGQWSRVQDLRTGMELQSMHGPICVGSIARRPLPYIGKVYNLKVKDGDRYLVGKDGIIVRDY